MRSVTASHTSAARITTSTPAEPTPNDEPFTLIFLPAHKGDRKVFFSLLFHQLQEDAFDFTAVFCCLTVPRNMGKASTVL
jgi:hypothetical protein